MSHAIPIRVPPLELPPNSCRLHACEEYPPKSFELHTYEIALPQVLWIACLRNQGGGGGIQFQYRVAAPALLAQNFTGQSSRGGVHSAIPFLFFRLRTPYHCPNSNSRSIMRLHTPPGGYPLPTFAPTGAACYHGLPMTCLRRFLPVTSH